MTKNIWQSLYINTWEDGLIELYIALKMKY